jgi:hypothetical protein
VSVLMSSKKEMEDVDGRIRVESDRIYSTEMGPSGEMVSGVQIRSVGLEDGVSCALGNRWSTTCPLSRSSSERVGTQLGQVPSELPPKNCFLYKSRSPTNIIDGHSVEHDGSTSTIGISVPFCFEGDPIYTFLGPSGALVGHSFQSYHQIWSLKDFNSLPS